MFFSRVFVWGNLLISLGSAACTAAVGSISVFSAGGSNKVIHCLHALLHMSVLFVTCSWLFVLISSAGYIFRSSRHSQGYCYLLVLWIHIFDAQYIQYSNSMRVFEYCYLSFNMLNIFWTQTSGSSILSFGILTLLSYAKHTILYFNHYPYYYFSPCAGSSEYDCRLRQPQTSFLHIPL